MYRVRMRTLGILIRAVGSLVILAALAAQLLLTVQNEADSTGQLGYVILNFFSFFTVESNLMAVFVLGLGALYASGIRKEPTWFGTVRAAVTTYMVVTGLVYNILLRGIELPQGTTVGWSNEVLHVVAPIILLLDWFLIANPRRVTLRAIWCIVSFPVLWVAYTLMRGSIALDPRSGERWYPYPFLNPELASTAYLSVSLYVLLIAVIIGLTGLTVLKTAPIRRTTHKTPVAA